MWGIHFSVARELPDGGHNSIKNPILIKKNKKTLFIVPDLLITSNNLITHSLMYIPSLKSVGETIEDDVPESHINFCPKWLKPSSVNHYIHTLTKVKAINFVNQLTSHIKQLLQSLWKEMYFYVGNDFCLFIFCHCAESTDIMLINGTLFLSVVRVKLHPHGCKCNFIDSAIYIDILFH